MKKLALATAISLISVSSAHALTVVEKDGFKYVVKGDLQVQLRQKHGEDKDLDIDYDDAELKNSVSYDLGNGMKAFGQIDYDFKKAKTEETYLGLDFSGTKVLIGDTAYATDDFGVDQDIEGAISGDSFPVDSSDDLIKVETSFSGVDLIASFDLSDSEDETSSFDIFAGVSAGPVDLAFAYQALSDYESQDVNSVGISAAADAGPATLGLAYSTSTYEEDGKDDIDLTVTHLVATMPVAATTKVNVGYEILEEDEKDDINAWYVNTVYKFPNAKNVSLHAELTNTDEDDSDVGYTAGMRIKF